MTNTKTMTEAARIDAVRNYIANANGTDQWYRHGPMGDRMQPRFAYSSGVRLIAEMCGAYWLIDLVLSYQRDPETRLSEKEPFQVWEVREAGEGAQGVVIEATDGGRDGHEPRVIARQAVAHTDFPRMLLPLRLYLEDGALMLPEER